MKRKKFTIFEELKLLLGHKKPTKNEASHAAYVLRSKRGRR